MKKWWEIFLSAHYLQQGVTLSGLRIMPGQSTHPSLSITAAQNAPHSRYGIKLT
jgi:hypothetical protein